MLSSDRTLAVAAGRTAFDLDIASPHPLTASPPRDATVGRGDPSGCAGGSESRTSHAASSGDALGKQSAAPLSEHLAGTPRLWVSAIVEA